MIIARNKLDYFWWTSIMCFPLGIFIADLESVFYKNKNIIGAFSLLFLVLCLYKMHGQIDNEYTILAGVLFSIFVVSVSNRLILKNSIIDFFGKNSLEFYLFHIIPCYYIVYPITDPHLHSIVRFFSTFILACFFFYIQITLIKPLFNGK